MVHKQPPSPPSPGEPQIEGQPRGHPQGEPPPYSEINAETTWLDKFRAFATKWEISEPFARKLRQLEGFEIVLILDDSSSMMSPLNDNLSSAFAQTITRWDELQQTAGIIVDIASFMDKDGVDLYFLNRGTILNVTSSDKVKDIFKAKPSGPTPISKTLLKVLHDKKTKSNLNERKVLIIIATDGEPTDHQGRVDISTLRQILERDRDSRRVHVSFLACTDDDSTIKYLQDWDENITNVDVVDDYKSEREQVRKVQGERFPFSYGDYIVKILLGSIDPELDALDEAKTIQVNEKAVLIFIVMFFFFAFVMFIRK